MPMPWALPYVGTQPHDTYGQADVFLVLCSDGTIYQTAFAYSSKDQKYVIFPFTALVQIPGMAAGAIGRLQPVLRARSASSSSVP